MVLLSFGLSGIMFLAISLHAVSKYLYNVSVVSVDEMLWNTSNLFFTFIMNDFRISGLLFRLIQS